MNELTKKTNCKVQNRHEIIAISIIMQTRLSRPETIKFRSDLGFNQINLILKKEQSIVVPLLKAFSAEKIKLQHKALENERVKTGIYFSEHELVVKIDKKGDIDRNQNKKGERHTKIGKHLNYKFHRINPDAENLNILLKLAKYKIALLNQTKKK